MQPPQLATHLASRPHLEAASLLFELPLADPLPTHSTTTSPLPVLPPNCPAPAHTFRWIVYLPHGKALFQCSTTATVASQLLAIEALSTACLGQYWEDLLASGYHHNSLVFLADVDEPSLDGQPNRMQLRCSEVTPGATIHGLVPPELPSSGATPSPLLAPQVAAQLLPTTPPTEGAAAHFDLSSAHLFLVNNFSIDMEAHSVLELGQGIKWWPANAYPGREAAIKAFANHRNAEIGPRPLSGVISVPHSPNLLSPEARRADLAVAHKKLKRVRLLLNVLHDCVPYIIGHASCIYTDTEITQTSYDIYSGIEYRHSSPPYWVRKKRYSSSTLRFAIGLAFGQGGGLREYLRRAIDSLDLARAVDDTAISVLLTWACIEALLSPPKEEKELTTNLALNLIGLAAPIPDPPAYLKAIKGQYSIRSRIVHSFELPDDADLHAALRFADEHATMTLRALCRGNYLTKATRETFVADLRQRAFAASTVASLDLALSNRGHS